MESYLESLRQTAEAAKAAETDYRKEATLQIATLEQERTFAFRRLNLMQAIAEAVAPVGTEEIAIANALAALRMRLGWTSDSEARAELLEHFSPVAIAMAHETPHEENGTAIAEALSSFERWHAESRGVPFWTLFEQPMPDTPRIDF